MSRYVRVHSTDHVAIAVEPLSAGEVLRFGDLTVTLATDIPKGHKIALYDIAPGQEVLKFGFVIGKAIAPIAAGEHIHTHNLATALSGVEDYAYLPEPAEGPGSHPDSRTFMGYRRADGRVGIRNEIWILCTVGCVARTSERLAKVASERFKGRVDGVYALTHPLGCSQLGDDLSHTRKLLAALASHPNAGGVLIVGLGCENNQLTALLDEIQGRSPDRLKYFAAQMVDDEHEAGLEALEELVAVVEKDQRELCHVSDLAIGVKCGGSDGFSGLTANPLVGRVADTVAQAGGMSIMTEIPEVFGAERILMARAKDENVFHEIVDVVNDFKQYFLDNNQPVFENPSPGNKAGGITTLEEKSLGAVQKGGLSQLTEVLRYGERASQPGLSLLEAPGNDAVSSTALTAAGAVIVLFTTGRGTPLGFPAPTLKIASNTALAEKKPHWIDFNAGQALEGKTLDETADDLMDLILRVASGQQSNNEKNEEREIAIWKNGVTL
ncbi:altronate dehydratase family protein [Asticcacaulis sp. BYS171W]|uniref:Altronate dehydratase family protein n=1 Tax=Asticcacaulis aquaticus TaxID=2984212 RepID=A0ABT5HRM5_9CAUL|nr:altronate dehydratase family protein [Asticcacaulis aquaticus]MDC7682720.1 altronate dehydratase family protein [Asticcacaulis aquaticus]